jgi:hypothetical protein
MYVGPEMLMPLASVLAGITGVLLFFWRRIVGFVRTGLDFTVRTIRRLRGRSSS